MKRILSTLCLPLLLSACAPSLSETQGTTESESFEFRESEGGIVCIAEGVIPKVSNLPSTQVEANINAELEDYLYTLEEQIHECPKMMADLVVEGSELTDSTDVSYSVKRLDNKYFSIVLIASQYFEGAAHPNNSIATFTFDISEGSKIALSEWFTDPEAGEKFLTDYINAKLKEEDMGMTYPSDTSNGLGAYYLTDTELVLTDLFAIHAVQGYEVHIPFADLAEVLSPDATL